VAHEVFHSMRNMKGRKGIMVIKVDLEKACDRLRCDFIRDTLIDMGFSIWLVNLMMHYIETTNLSVLWNDNPSSSFTPSRGIHQCDIISLYIFVLCLQRLSRLNCHVVELGV
jgi:hypothetical protein